MVEERSFLVGQSHKSKSKQGKSIFAISDIISLTKKLSFSPKM
jgi:hypothetical protein